MSKILIAPIIPVVNHYTIEWAHFLPRMLRNAGFDVIDAVASAQRLTCDELDHLHTFFRSKRLFALLDTLS